MNADGIDNGSDNADVVFVDACGGDGMKRSSANVSGGGSGDNAAGRGIKLSSLENLMEDMISTFKVVRNDQSNESSSSSYCSTDGMPFLEEALGEPLGRLAAIARRDHPDRRNQSRHNNHRRSGGLDFDDMYERLVRFQKVGNIDILHNISSASLYIHAEPPLCSRPPPTIVKFQLLVDKTDQSISKFDDECIN